jgi:hypothetical protein
MSSSDVSSEAWNTFTGDRSVFPGWRGAACFFSTTANATHFMGLLGHILSPAEFLLWATSPEMPNPQPFVLLPAPEEIPAAGAQFPAWQHTAKEYKQQQVDILAFRKVFVAKLDAASIRGMSETDNDFGIARRSTAWMLAWMDAKFRVATPEVIAATAALMDVAFVDNGEQTVVQYMDTNHAIPHRVAASMEGGAYHETTKVNKLIMGLTPCGEFKDVITFFRLTYKTAAAQTYALLSTLVEDAEPNRTAQKKSSGSGLVNQATMDPVMKAMFDQIAGMQAAITTLAANAAAAQQPNSKRPARGTPRAPRAAPAQRDNSDSKKERTHYCHTHGPNLSHNSPECNWPSVDHLDTATYANKMGGALVYTRTNK